MINKVCKESKVWYGEKPKIKQQDIYHSEKHDVHFIPLPIFIAGVFNCFSLPPKDNKHKSAFP